ncbi:MAG: hypothetical protein AMJ92_04350 [candidate division Zixibacteria bacterium SM23_81]|nr:MAG: hypothetical protein AMJ92_04350 [candidate division Zixibacteria bacterium SM23_81]
MTTSKRKGQKRRAMSQALRNNLLKEKIHVPPGRLVQYLEALRGARHIFPISQEQAIFVGLMEKWRKVKDQKTVVYVSRIEETGSFPTTVSFGVLGSDWPGMSDSCIGVLHQRGWNVDFAKGMVVEQRGQQLGVVIMAVVVTTAEELNRLSQEKDSLVEALSKASIGSLAKAYLIARESRRLETYSRVIEAIEKQCPPEDLEALLGRRGEVVMFFASRPEEYIHERDIKDLVEQIITNYHFLQRVRESGGRPQVRIKNLKTVREHLTGITLAGYDREISLNDCLDAIEHAVPGFKRKFNKEFTTPDGITVYRLEITDKRDRALSREQIRHIRKALLQMATSKKFQRAKWTEATGGFEHYARAIIPFLLKEFRSSNIPQVYLSVGKATDFFLEFKIIIILSGTRPTQERDILKCVEALDSVSGLSVLSTNPPRIMGDEGINIINVRADLDVFADRQRIYENIKDQLGQVIGQFRDFDEGIRILETKKLGEVREHFRRTREDLVREFYYRLEDFYRVSASVEELVQQIRMGIRSLRRLAKSQAPFYIEGKNVRFGKGAGERMSTLICIGFDPKSPAFTGCLGILSDYEVTMSKVEREEATVLLIQLTKDGVGLEAAKLRQVLRELRETLASCVMRD